MNGNRLSKPEIVSSEELSILTETFLSSQKVFSYRHSAIFLFLLIHLKGVILKIEEHFDFAVSLIFEIALNNALLEVTIKSQNMSI